MRLNKYLASCGIGSRRKVEDLILQGKIKINNMIVNQLSTIVNENDIVLYDDEIIKIVQEKVYYLLNKPCGVLSSVSDDRGRKTVVDIFNDIDFRVFPIGRLDLESQGMIIMTNDGDFANSLIHPSKDIEKEYMVLVDKMPTEKQITNLQNGVVIDEYKTREVKVFNVVKNNNVYQFNIVIKEGKKRQIRRMANAVGLRVVALKRIRIGNLKMNDLQIGKYIKLTKDDLQLLLSNGG